MTAMDDFLYNSLSKSMKYDLWLLGAVSFTTPYQNALQDDLWLLGAINMSYDSYGPFPLQLLIKIIEIWPMTAIGNFHYNSLSKSMKYDLWLLWVISFTIPYQHHWNMTCESYGPFQLQFLITIIEIWAMTAMGDFLDFLSKSLKYDLWQLWAISITIPYQNHWNMTYDCYGPFPLQLLIKIIGIWHLANMTYDCSGQFPLQFLIKIIEIWPMTAMGSFPLPFLIKIIEIWPMAAMGNFL